VAIWWRRGWWQLPVGGGVRWAGAVVSDGGDWQAGCHPAAFL